MRDLLEELLELTQDQEEDQAARELLEQARTGAAGLEKPGEPEFAGQEDSRRTQNEAGARSQAARDPAGQAQAVRRRTAEREAKTAGREMVLEPENRSAALPVQEGEGESAEALRAQVVQAQRQVRYPRAPASSAVQDQGGAVWLRERPAQAAGVQVRQVDRAFERDARRYDSRFTLF